jgi:hypothetical protein
LYVADGLIALIGRRKALKWMDSTVTPRMPRNWRGTMHELADMDDRMLSMLGINQVLAGAGLLLASLAASRRICEVPRQQTAA